MEYIKEFLIILVPLSGLICSLLIYIFRNEKYFKEVISVISSFCMFVFSLLVGREVISGNFLSYELFNLSPTLSIYFKADRPAVLFALVASFLWIITNFYSIEYLKGTKDKKETSFYCYFALTLFATTALAFSGNIVTTFIFYELITIFTYPLVTHKGTKEAVSAGRKYLAYLMGLSILFFLTALFLTYGITESLNFQEKGLFASYENKKLLILILFLYFFGIAKTAVIPIHHWLPTAMIAPTPVSALLHAVAVVKAGVFTLFRVLNYVFTPEIILKINGHFLLIAISSATIIIASLIALKQDNLKLRLAYSTISQLSYVVLGFSLLNKISTLAGLSHIIMHAFGKITLFFCAGAIYVQTHKTEVSQLSGIGKRMPFTMFAFAIGSLSMIGIPGFGGFVSKFLLFKGISDFGNYWLFFVLGLSTLLNASYFLPIVYKAFFEEPEKTEGHRKNLESLFLLIPVLVTALISVLLFFACSYIYDFIGDVRS
ncbi:MAG: proton-conducting transporter membrane subunit [Proteobacteria bacterium]|nr:proton-conducting transporter membrane subunit [Pseudomonadota bacterium]